MMQTNGHAIIPTNATFASGHRSCCFCVLYMNATNKMSLATRQTRRSCPFVFLHVLDGLTVRPGTWIDWSEGIWSWSGCTAPRRASERAQRNWNLPLDFLFYIYLHSIDLPPATAPESDTLLSPSCFARQQKKCPDKKSNMDGWR